ncbi:MAG TPA: gluconokinase [Streptosporangiaceae bacterium]|jgi:carbohydrate kinase (thermoresistant glucokinase family)|nr:gluconokinase [Streptosporangiaceae bacterium]
MIVMVAGIAGSGKTTVGQLLAARLGWEFADGDRFHSPAAVAKMQAGIPLADDDRWPWLDAIGAWVDHENAAGRSAVVACSALRRSYRQRLLTGRPELRMFFLVISHDADEARLTTRHGHFFPGKLLDSQFAALEVPEPSEGVTLIPATGTPEQAVDEIVRDLGQPA